jgi:hypothetical protein
VVIYGTQFKLFRSKCVTCSDLLKVTAPSDKQDPLHWRRVHLRAKTLYISFLAYSILLTAVFEHGKQFDASKEQKQIYK